MKSTVDSILTVIRSVNTLDRKGRMAVYNYPEKDLMGKAESPPRSGKKKEKKVEEQPT